MGVKYFFSWFKKSFSKHIKTIRYREKVSVSIDTFLIDLNGILHYCAQKAFRYGAFKGGEKLPYNRQLAYFLDQTGEYINHLVSIVQPQKKLVICIDGVAPVSKQFQQRQRRYKSSEIDFDSNCITPGTKFLDNLSNYLEWFIRLKLTKDPSWNFEVIFSNEKVPGEGEHKLVKYVRLYGDENDHYMIHGMDADLIMLALASQRENFHILRENPYKNEFFHIDMKSIRENLVYTLLQEPTMKKEQFFINDFILMMFMSGNDFLPNLPTIDILEGSIETFFDVYRRTVSSYGNLVTPYFTIDTKPLSILLGTLASDEKSILEERRKHLKDSLLEKHTTLINKDPETYQLNWEEYRKEYYTKLNCHSEKDIEKVCIQYLEGMQWVLTYYLEGVSSWVWYYPHSYAPFCSDIQKYCKNIEKIVSSDKPYDPLFQLLCVLPPKSASLLPEALQSIFENPKTSIYYPKETQIDMDGKRNEWEGIVKLPLIDHFILHKEYKKKLSSIDQRDKYRNKIDTSKIYTKSSEFYKYKSYHGELNCNVIVKNIDL